MDSYHVEWDANIDAGSPAEAVREALDIHLSKGSIGTRFKVTAPDGSEYRVDIDTGDAEPTGNIADRVASPAMIAVAQAKVGMNAQCILDARIHEGAGGVFVEAWVHVPASEVPEATRKQLGIDARPSDPTGSGTQG